MTHKTPKVALLPVAILLLLFCENPNMRPAMKSLKLPEFPPEASARKLSRITVFFGHQSIGYNILDGIRDIVREYPPLALNVVETTDLATSGVPVFAHSRIGRNGLPLSKLDEFSAALRRRDQTSTDIASMKFCFVDFTEQTDVQDVFARYVETFATLRASFPRTTFVHMTVPLTGDARNLMRVAKNAINKLLGRHVFNYKDNIKINQFNDLLRGRYLGKEPVFDLAFIESTHADGTRVMVREPGMTVYSLASEYTNDGGHLNERGRRIVALELLRFLAALS